jgi:hypothetical protein
MYCDLPAPGHNPSLNDRRQTTQLDLFETPAYARFDGRMDEALDRLVARWMHAAAPGACRNGWLTTIPR